MQIFGIGIFYTNKINDIVKSSEIAIWCADIVSFIHENDDREH